MAFDPSTTLWLAIAAVGGLCALGIWFVFLRPVPRQTAAGVITQKTFKPASTHWVQPTGQRTNFWMPVAMPVTECYVFTIRPDGHAVEAIFSLNTTAAEYFQVGQRVSIDYEERGIPPIWKRAYVIDMKRM